MNSRPDSQLSEHSNLVIVATNARTDLSRVAPQLVELGLKDLGEDYRQWCNKVCQPSGASAAVHGQVLDHEQISDLEQIAALYRDETVFCADSRNLRVIESLAKAFPETRFIFLYSQLDEALRSGSEDNQSTPELIEQWQTSGEQLIKLHRRFRNRSLLINAEQFLEHPQNFVSLASRINLELKADANIVTDQLGSNAVGQYIAQQIFKEQPRLQALALELEASAFPLAEQEHSQNVSPVEVNDVLRQWRQENQQLRANLDNLTAALNAQKAEHEELSASRDHLRQQRDEFDLRIQKLQKTIAELEEGETQSRAALTEQKEENELLLLQLHQVQEELEATFLDNQKLIQEKEELTSSNDEVESLQSQLRDLQSAHNEMSTSRDHIRQQRDELDLKVKDANQQLSQANQQVTQLREQMQEQEEENELLLLQLHQVQEELEHYYLKGQELISRLDEEKAMAQGKQERALNWLAAEYNVQPPSALSSLFKRKNRHKLVEQKNIHLIEASGLFDHQWYIEQNPDVAENNLDPVKHYLRYGAAEGRNPSPQFNTTYYLESNQDVAESGVNPLVHYIRFGFIEGRPTEKAD